jgi:GTP cyclohydrolase II
MKQLPLTQAANLRAALATLNQREPATTIESRSGQLQLTLFEGRVGGSGLIASSGLDDCPLPTIRLHSACLFGESFHSLECECRAQLDAALDEITERGGALIYSFQEGRGIGLCAKIVAMELERVRKISTTDAFKTLGFEPDPRRYDDAVQALAELCSAREIRLITNNPHKLEAFTNAGFVVAERVEPWLKLPRRSISIMRARQRVLGQIPYGNVRALEI